MSDKNNGAPPITGSVVLENSNERVKRAESSYVRADRRLLELEEERDNLDHNTGTYMFAGAAAFCGFGFLLLGPIGLLIAGIIGAYIGKKIHDLAVERNKDNIDKANKNLKNAREALERAKEGIDFANNLQQAKKEIDDKINSDRSSAEEAASNQELKKLFDKLQALNKKSEELNKKVSENQGKANDLKDGSGSKKRKELEGKADTAKSTREEKEKALQNAKPEEKEKAKQALKEACLAECETRNDLHTKQEALLDAKRRVFGNQRDLMQALEEERKALHEVCKNESSKDIAGLEEHLMAIKNQIIEVQESKAVNAKDAMDTCAEMYANLKEEQKAEKHLDSDDKKKNRVDGKLSEVEEAYNSVRQEALKDIKDRKTYSPEDEAQKKRDINNFESIYTAKLAEFSEVRGDQIKKTKAELAKQESVLDDQRTNPDPEDQHVTDGVKQVNEQKPAEPAVAHTSQPAKPDQEQASETPGAADQEQASETPGAAGQGSEDQGAVPSASEPGHSTPEAPVPDPKRQEAVAAQRNPKDGEPDRSNNMSQVKPSGVSNARPSSAGVPAPRAGGQNQHKRPQSASV